MVLAYRGGKPIITTPIKIRDSLSYSAKAGTIEFLSHARGHDLSGYLAGAERGGGAVQRLETIWAQTYGVSHTIACNSATSGILAAFIALEPSLSDRIPMTVHIPVMGMSAIAAVPSLLGFDIVFHDIDEHYCIKIDPAYIQPADIILAVNLFGHPARLHELRALADGRGAFLIEDNAQGLNATERCQLAGTIGHIGVWSGNVHKPLNVGELGLITTNDYALAKGLRGAINHGEASEGRPGLNLRPTELTAIMAMCQIRRALDIVERSRDIALALADTYTDGFFRLPTERDGCRSAWYCLAIEAPTKAARDQAVIMLAAEGLPCRAGYVRIDKMKAFTSYLTSKQTFPNADLVDDHLLLVELCSLEPTDEQVVQMSEALSAVGEEIENGRRTLRRGDIRKSRPKPRKRTSAHKRSKEATS
jgi:perosamine synthetase